MRAKKAKLLRKLTKEMTEGLPWVNYMWLRVKTKILHGCGRGIYQAAKRN